MPLYQFGNSEPQIDPTAFVHPDAILIGDVRIGARASVWPTAVLCGDDNGIEVGAETSIQDGARVSVSAHRGATIGARCVVGHLAVLHCCTVEDGALVGSGSRVQAGAVIEGGALVGAGALVEEGVRVPSRALAVGVPARLRPDAVDPAKQIEIIVDLYIERVRRYKSELRLIG